LSEAQRQQITANLGAEGIAPPRHGGDAAKRRAWLEAFRSASFQATAISPGSEAGEPGAVGRATRVEGWIKAAVPILTPEQRSTLAERLRARARRASTGVDG
jgi:hypothetical protein